MLPGRQADFSLGLPRPKMQVVEIVRNRLIKWWQLGVDQQVMVPGILSVGARRRHPHATKAKMYHRLRRQRITILEVDEINGRPWRRRCWSARSDLAVSGSRHRSPNQGGKGGCRKCC